MPNDEIKRENSKSCFGLTSGIAFTLRLAGRLSKRKAAAAVFLCADVATAPKTSSCIRTVSEESRLLEHDCVNWIFKPNTAWRLFRSSVTHSVSYAGKVQSLPWRIKKLHNNKVTNKFLRCWINIYIFFSYKIINGNFFFSWTSLQLVMGQFLQILDSLKENKTSRHTLWKMYFLYSLVQIGTEKHYQK